MLSRRAILTGIALTPAVSYPASVGNCLATPKTATAKLIADRWIRASYKRFLAREPDPSGLQHWMHLFESSDGKHDVLLGLLCSEEYFQNRAGGTNRMFVTALWRDLFDFGLDERAETVVSDLERGISRLTIINTLLNPETLLTVERLITADLNSVEGGRTVRPWEYSFGKWMTQDSSQSFQSSDRLVCTSFFYWYDLQQRAGFLADPDMSGKPNDGKPAFSIHPPAEPALSYLDLDWIERQLNDMSVAGIDVVLPVYLGSPFSTARLTNHEARMNEPSSFSDDGLAKIVDAARRIGNTAPKIGMFYDTTSINRLNAKGWHVRLASFGGQEWFYETIRNFISQVPPDLRACIDGKPIVFVYHPSFGADVSEGLYPYTRASFRKEFGTELYIVSGAEEDAPRITDPQSVEPWARFLERMPYLDVLAEMLSSLSGNAVGINRLRQFFFDRGVTVGPARSIKELLASYEVHRAIVGELQKRVLRDDRPLQVIANDPSVIKASKEFGRSGDYFAVLATLLANDQTYRLAGATDARFAEYVIQMTMLRSTNPTCGACASFSIDGEIKKSIMQALKDADRLAAVMVAVEHIETKRATASRMIFDHVGRYNPGPFDSSFSWASAIAPTLKGIASLGPGYDQGRLTTRSQIYVDREDGELYTNRWEDIISMDPRPRVVHIESWNELFEGTGICETLEFGRKYIDITAQMSRKYKSA